MSLSRPRRSRIRRPSRRGTTAGSIPGAMRITSAGRLATGSSRNRRGDWATGRMPRGSDCARVQSRVERDAASRRRWSGAAPNRDAASRDARRGRLVSATRVDRPVSSALTRGSRRQRAGRCRALCASLPRCKVLAPGVLLAEQGWRPSDRDVLRQRPDPVCIPRRADVEERPLQVRTSAYSNVATRMLGGNRHAYAGYLKPTNATLARALTLLAVMPFATASTRLADQQDGAPLVGSRYSRSWTRVTCSCRTPSRGRTLPAASLVPRRASNMF